MAGLFKRGKKYYALYYNGATKRRVSLNTSSLQIAKEKLRRIESSLFQGDANPLPTKTPLEKMLNEYVEYMISFKTAKSVQTDVYYLRAMFGESMSGVNDHRTQTQPQGPEAAGDQAGQASQVQGDRGQILGGHHHQPDRRLHCRPGLQQGAGP